MIKRKSNSLGLEFDYTVAGTYQEYNDLAKRVDKAGNAIDACLEDAVEHIVQHNMNSEFRDVFLYGRAASEGVSEIKGVQQMSGIDPKTESVLSPTKADPNRMVDQYTEKESVYFKRVLATMGVEKEHFASLAQTVADAVVFDPSATEPKEKKPPTLPKAFADKVAKIHADGNYDKAVARIAKDIGKTHTLTGDKAKDDESLGFLVREHAQWIALNKSGY